MIGALIKYLLFTVVLLFVLVKANYITLTSKAKDAVPDSAQSLLPENPDVSSSMRPPRPQPQLSTQPLSSNMIHAEHVERGSPEERFLMDSISQFNNVEADTYTYQLNNLTTAADRDRHAEFAAKSKPKSGYQANLSDSIFEPPPMPRYNAYYRPPNQPRGDSMLISVNGIDNSEYMPKWSNTGI